MHHEGREVKWEYGAEVYGRWWWWWSWVGQQVGGPGSCGEESGLPRLGSLAGASCPPMDVDVSSALSAQWQAAYDDEGGCVRAAKNCSEASIYYCHYFSASSCYIHCYVAACLRLLFAWTKLASSTRGSSPPVSLALPPHSAHHHPALSPPRAEQTYASQTPIAADTSH